MSMRGGGPGRFLGNERQAKPSRPTKVLLSHLREFLAGLEKPIIAFFFLSLIYALTLVISPVILSQGIEAFYEIDQGKVMLFNHQMSIGETIVLLLGIFYLLNILGFFLDSFATKIFANITGTFVNNIRVKLYDKLINSSMDYLKNQQSGNITSRITSDTDQITTGIQTFTRIASQFVLLITTLVILILGTRWQILLICLCSVPVALLISAILTKFGRKIILKIRRAFGIVSGKMAESFAGVIVAKSFNREASLSKQMAVLNQQHYKMSQKFGIMMFITMPLINAIGRITSAFILYTGGVIDLSVAEIFLAISLSGRFLRPITFLAMAFPELQNAMGSLDRVLDIMEAAPILSDIPDAKELNGDYSVTFDNVWFSYLPNEEIIKGISLEVQNGEIIALIGKTGAGKTTIASNLIPRFYDIQKGRILIGGQDIKRVTQQSLRNAIGLIPQDPYLFSASVMENLRYGKPGAMDHEIYAICKLLGADLFIEALPEGYDTKLTEGGKKLSAGQRQMITIARTMLADPQILILDEATSRLDAYSESLVQRAQDQLFEGRTTFVIAHRLSTIHHSDKIVVLDDGKIVEKGTHKDLLEKSGVYADLYHTYYSFQGFEELNLKKSN